MALNRKIIVIAYTDGHVDKIPMTPSLEMRYEREFKNQVSKLGEQGMVELMQYAWSAARAKAERDREPILGATAWAEQVEAIDLEVEEIHPTDAAATAAGSQASPSPQE